MDLNLQAQLFLYNGKVGDFYMDGDNKISITKRTPKKIYLSNGVIVNIKKTKNNVLYLDSRGVRHKNRTYPLVNQIIRDIEGYFLYKLHCHKEFEYEI